MLTSVLNRVPPVKLLVLEDRLEFRCRDVLEYLISKHLECSRNVLYYSCERNSKSITTLFNKPYFKLVNLLNNEEPFNLISNQKFAGEKTVIIIDSLTLLLLTIGESKAYSFLNTLKQSKDVVQIICVFHLDTIINSLLISQCLNYLSDLNVEFLKSEQGLSKGRVLYNYKKSSGKIVRQFEYLTFVNGALISEPVKKVNVETLLENYEANPEEMASFKIGLDDKEKQERDRLQLPYLPNQNDNEKEAKKGNVVYEMEEADDWDPEDPDDDLDF